MSIKKTKISLLDLGLSLALAAVVLFAPDLAMASDPAGLSGTLCNALGLVSESSFGRAIAMAAVITLAIGAMIGRVQWMTAVLICVGVAAMINANEIINFVTGDDACAT